MTESFRNHLSLALKARYASVPHPMIGRKLSGEQRAKMSAFQKVRPRSEESRQKQRTAKLGTTHTEATKEKIKQRLREKFPNGRPVPMKGKHHTAEALQKMRKPLEDYWRGRDRSHSAETRAKLSAMNMGVSRPHTGETREKMKASQRLRRQREANEVSK